MLCSQFELLFRRSVLGPSYKQTIIDKFENGTLKVFFRLYLDRRKIPRTVTNLEDTIQDIIAKETYSTSSLFKDMELDLTTIQIRSDFFFSYINFFLLSFIYFFFVSSFFIASY